MTHYWYRAYGLIMRLPFACPVLPAAEATDAADVCVVEREVPRCLATAQVEGPNWQATAGRYLLRAGAKAGRFLVEGGERVVLQRGVDCRESWLAFHFVDTVLAAVLRHRGLLVLHAGTAVTPDGAVAVAGYSGAGKSTTLAGLVARGCAMLADEVTAARQLAGDRFEVLPGVPTVDLCPDAAVRLARTAPTPHDEPSRRHKLSVPMREAMATAATPWRALYLLAPVATGAVKVTALTGADKFHAVQESAFGPLPAGEPDGQFELFAAACRAVDVYRIERPVDRWTADEVVEAVLG